MDYDGDLGICEYRVMSKEQLRKATEDDFHCKEKVTDKTVIKNAALNKMINDRLNGNSVQLTNIHFFTENNQICFQVYTSDNCECVCHCIWDCSLCMHRDHCASESVNLKTRFSIIDSTLAQSFWGQCLRSDSVTLNAHLALLVSTTISKVQI